jgi:hypothetical protein
LIISLQHPPHARDRDGRARKTATFSENPYLRLFALAVFAAAMLTAVVVLANSARAGSAFDGAWRVTIITQSGNCDPAYSYPVKVEGGRSLFR